MSMFLVQRKEPGMQVIRSGFSHQRPVSVVFVLLLSSVDVCAESVCPAYVELPTGSAFNLARLIADTGSPELALRKIRAALAQVTAAGGCPKAEEPNACEETLAVARKAMAALQACTSHAPPEETAEQNRQAPSK
ncbi:hypothetical protein [Burkholderia sp. Ac-20365]|jgi:hypothetical protein|uniref:hypothetical protein n=1 Tax=Burkholderia sp. Ac-20365 TaxID=2703897 RepID=UPI001F11C10B|nr:hypothetical protein [Burkholderia sp. Ac-20365]